MTWASVYVALLISHVAGDFLLQTEWQALNKRGGLLGSGESRRALLTHGFSYTCAYIPALIWIGGEHGVAAALGLAALVMVPHVVVDDGWLLRRWMAHVKHSSNPVDWLSVAVDQSFHVVALLPVALLAAT